jgi:hypothetical protein
MERSVAGVSFCFSLTLSEIYSGLRFVAMLKLQLTARLMRNFVVANLITIIQL